MILSSLGQMGLGPKENQTTLRNERHLRLREAEAIPVVASHFWEAIHVVCVSESGTNAPSVVAKGRMSVSCHVEIGIGF